MINKYKIYIFHPYSQVGGADLSISRLTNKLSEKEYDIDFIYLNKQNLSNYLSERKVNYIKIKSKRTVFSVSKIRDHLIKDKKKNYKKYIFLSNQNFANVLSFAVLFNLNWIKHILIERNHIDEFKFNKSFKKFIIFKLIKYLYRYADAVVGISKKLSSDLSKYINKKCITIYNPAFDKNIINLSRKKISIKKKKNTILTVGRLEDQKDIKTLIKAFKLVVRKVNSNLIIIGYGSQVQKLKKIINKNKLQKHVKILTNITNPFPYYKIAKTFVLSSKYEGFGNVLVEAAMFKINVISSNCNSGPKEILLNGKGGQLFKVGNHIELSNKIIKSLKLNQKKQIETLYNSLERFNVENNIRAYKKLFGRI